MASEQSPPGGHGKRKTRPGENLAFLVGATPSKDLSAVGAAYRAAVLRHGPTAAGVGWSSSQAQMLRLRVLTRILDDDPDEAVTLADIGCGYGALWPLVAERRAPRVAAYTGYDIVPRMVSLARAAHGADPRARFQLGEAPEGPVDYALVSGTYNFRDRMPVADWRARVERALAEVAAHCRKGLAVNFLHRRGGRDLRHMYYTTPDDWTETARSLARGGTVTVVDDYLPDDFSLLIRFGP